MCIYLCIFPYLYVRQASLSERRLSSVGRLSTCMRSMAARVAFSFSCSFSLRTFMVSCSRSVLRNEVSTMSAETENVKRSVDKYSRLETSSFAITQGYSINKEHAQLNHIYSLDPHAFPLRTARTEYDRMERRVL